ncbi:MAG: hypothetical protein ABH812_01560 [bacterium]
MSEPTQLQLKNIVEIFLDEYNKDNNTSFEWNKDKSYVAKSSDKKWIDAIVYDKRGNELQIQHKEVIWDIKYDKIRSGATDKIVKKLIETLSSRGLSEVTVHLNFYQKNVISSDKEIDEFCFWIAELINLKLSDGYPKSYHLFLLPKTPQGYWIRIKSTLAVFFRGVRDSFYIAIDKPIKVRQHIYSFNNDDDIYLNKIKEITSYLTVFRNPGQKKAVVGWGYSEPEPRPLPHFGDVVVSEINRKVINRYNNLIVLLDCNRPVDDYDRDLILSQVKQLSFTGQIWIVENFASKRKATCIFDSLKQR